MLPTDAQEQNLSNVAKFDWLDDKSMLQEQKLFWAMARHQSKWIT